MSKAVILSVALALSAACPAFALSRQGHEAIARVSMPESFQRPRMVQIRPGTWVGSYQCVYASGRTCDSN